jgi:hypothetical protein
MEETMRIWDAMLAAGLSCGLVIAQTPQAKAPASNVKTNAKVGEMAPDFTLRSTAGKDITLSSYRGQKNVVLAFIVKAFTGG